MRTLTKPLINNKVASNDPTGITRPLVKTLKRGLPIVMQPLVTKPPVTKLRATIPIPNPPPALSQSPTHVSM